MRLTETDIARRILFMSDCAVVAADQIIGHHHNEDNEEEEKPQKYIDEDTNDNNNSSSSISVTLVQKAEQEAKTPLIDECSMPTAPSVIALRQQQHQQLYNNDNNNHLYQLNGHNANNNNVAGVVVGGCCGSNCSTIRRPMPICAMAPPAAAADQANTAAPATMATVGSPRGVHGAKSTTTATAARCCCGLVRIRHVAYVLGLLEFIIFATQLIVCLVDLFGHADDAYGVSFGPKSAATTAAGASSSAALSTLLTIVSLILALTASMLLLSGVLFRSPYLLVPHILMQCAFICASLVMVGYLFSWWLGGFKIRISAIVFENSEKGFQGAQSANDRPPIRANFAVDEFNIVILLLIILNALFVGIQLWLLHLIVCMFRFLRNQQSKGDNDGTTLWRLTQTNAAHSDTADSRTTVMMLSTVSDRSGSGCSPPNNSVYMNGHLPKPQQQHQHFSQTSAAQHRNHQQHII